VRTLRKNFLNERLERAIHPPSHERLEDILRLFCQEGTIILLSLLLHIACYSIDCGGILSIDGADSVNR
jgi:hypothetical protein